MTNKQRPARLAGTGQLARVVQLRRAGSCLLLCLLLTPNLAALSNSLQASHDGRGVNSTTTPTATLGTSTAIGSVEPVDLDDSNSNIINNNNNSSSSNNNNDRSSTSSNNKLAGGVLSSAVADDGRSFEDLDERLDIVERAQNNLLDSQLATNRTSASVSCDSGEIRVLLTFKEPFQGVAYANFDRSSPCKLIGEGARQYSLHLPLKGCGTREDAPRLFVNHVIVRFHRQLELEEDELKTIVCRYPAGQPPEPPPPPPAGPPAKLIEPAVEPAKLVQYEPFVVIAGLLFFALLMAGVGTTTKLAKVQTLKPVNIPVPIVARTDQDTYLDTQSVVDIENLQTTHKLQLPPKISSHWQDDVFITKLHEIDTVENLARRQQEQQLPRLTLRQMDDAYVNQEDEIVEREELAHHRRAQRRPRIELRTIEDTFITNLDELVENEDTIVRNDAQGQAPECPVDGRGGDS